jgi:hypothetical protein
MILLAAELNEKNPNTDMPLHISAHMSSYNSPESKPYHLPYALKVQQSITHPYLTDDPDDIKIGNLLTP